MDIGHMLALVWRRKLLIVQSMIFVGALAAVLAAQQEASYSATSRVLLLTNDPTVAALGAYGRPVDAEEFLYSQFEVAQSPDVRQRAADIIGGFEDVTGVEMGRGISVDVMTFTVASPVPEVARDASNALATAYVENRRQSAAAGLQQAVEDLDQRLAVIRGQLSAIEAELARRSVAAPPQALAGETEVVATSTLDAERDTTTEQYKVLYAQQQGLLVQMNVQRGVAEMLAEAALPITSDSRSPIETGLVGVVAGLALGCAVAFVLDQLDDRIRSDHDLGLLAPLQLLAELPSDPQLAKGPNGIAVVERPASALAESVRSLRTSTSFLGIDEPIRRIAVTSADAGDGKSFVALNLAAAYAQSGVRTILVSSDLRRPSLERILGVPRDVTGLCDAIIGASELNGRLVDTDSDLIAHKRRIPRSEALADAGPSVIAPKLLDTPVEHLWLLPAGHRPHQPAELLASQAAARAIDDIGELAELVVFDTPPLGAVTDAAVLAAHVDVVLVVVAAGRTRRGQLKKVIERLEQSRPRVIGVVLNRSSSPSGEHGYYTSDLDSKLSRRERRKATVGPR